jgi:hypothetical protein
MFIVYTFKNEEIRRFLWNHERKPKVIDNLCEQIKICEKRDYSIKFDAKKYAKVIHETAKMFCEAALEKAKQDQLTQAERQRRIDEADKINQIEQEFEAEQAEAMSDKIISYPTVESL